MKTALIALSLLFAPSAFAHPGGHGHAPAPIPQEEAPKAASTPDTYLGIVSELREQQGAAKEALDGDKIASLHRACARLVELADAVPGKAAGLAGEGAARAKEIGARIGEAANAIKASATNGDKPAATKGLAALLADVDGLAALAK